MRGRCNVANRWGSGTTCEKPSNTEAAKELQARIAAMQAERTKQDSIWIQEPEKESGSKTHIKEQPSK
jgi:hypothetical protein